MKKTIVVTLAFWLLTAFCWHLVYYSSERFSLIASGYPFARIVEKEYLNIFDYVDTDSLRSGAIVFSNDNPTGWIYQGISSPPYFIEFEEGKKFDFNGSRVGFDVFLTLTYLAIWPLLAIASFLTLLFLVQLRLKKCREPAGSGQPM